MLDLLNILVENLKPIAGWLALASLVVFVASLLGIHQLIVRLPADFFVEGRRRVIDQLALPVRWTVVILKNLFGCVCVVIGLIFLITPGQGLITLLLGVALLDVPYKRKVLYAILHRPAVWKTLNRIRTRAGREPFKEVRA